MKHQRIKNHFTTMNSHCSFDRSMNQLHNQAINNSINQTTNESINPRSERVKNRIGKLFD